MLRKIKCWLGLHGLSKNSIFESYGAIFLGGLCPRCGRLVQRDFLYNAWGKEEEVMRGEVSIMELTGTNPLLLADLESGKYMWDTRYYERYGGVLSTKWSNYSQ